MEKAQREARMGVFGGWDEGGLGDGMKGDGSWDWDGWMDPYLQYTIQRKPQADFSRMV